MSYNVLDERSVVLRLEFSIADAVHQRGILRVLGAALAAWWQSMPRSYSEVPDDLRADVGLPPAAEPAAWAGISVHVARMHALDRRLP